MRAMKQLHKLLVNLDATVESQHALHAAIILGKLSQATIIAVNVVNQHVVTNVSRHGGKSLSEIEVDLEENGWRYLYAAEEEAKTAGARIVLVQEQGYPEEVLPRLAGDYAVDLIIIGQCPRPRTDALCTRVADQLLEHTQCSVLVVR
jgi:nucleotide-binding universal stress UspA family protein